MDKLRKLTKLRGSVKKTLPFQLANLPIILEELKEDTQKLIAILKSLEWAVPTPEAMCEGACPSCYAGKPGYGVIETVKFERKNHMKVCQLADALESN